MFAEEQEECFEESLALVVHRERRYPKRRGNRQCENGGARRGGPLKTKAADLLYCEAEIERQRESEDRSRSPDQIGRRLAACQ